MKTYYVYIMANEARTIYIGVTNSLERRVWEHRNGGDRESDFVRRYGLTKLVYIEDFSDIRDAISREKQLKRWRAKKLALINAWNPNWSDLAEGWFV